MIVIFIYVRCYHGFLFDLPASDVEVFPIAALRCRLTHKGSVLGLDRCQVVPIMETVFSGKASQLGQDLCVDPTEEHILLPLVPIQLLKALAIQQKVQRLSGLVALPLKDGPGTPVHL